LLTGGKDIGLHTTFVSQQRNARSYHRAGPPGPASGGPDGSNGGTRWAEAPDGLDHDCAPRLRPATL